MRKLVTLFIVAILFSCDSENAPDCFQAVGTIVQETLVLEPFTEIIVYERSQLIVSQGSFAVTLETGENLRSDITINVVNGRLEIINENACNIARDYGITKVFVTAPNITEIQNSSGLPVLSDGTLAFQNLSLISVDPNDEDEFNIDGDFELDLDVTNLTITQNGLSNFFLSGNVTNLDLNFNFGDARFEGRDLVVDNADVYHRGTNDIIMNPQQSLTGTLLSTGDLIITNSPAVLSVEELYTGRLIIE